MRENISSEDVEAFNSYRLPIFVRSFYEAFPPIVRKRIDVTYKLMRTKGDDLRPNYDIAEKILDTLELMGFENMGIGGERLPLHNMSGSAKKKLEETVASIRAAKIVHRQQIAGKRYPTYSMVSVLPEWLLANKLCSAEVGGSL